jgi:hypothetical protein
VRAGLGGAANERAAVGGYLLSYTSTKVHSNFSRCEANGGIDIGTTGPLVSTAAPTTTQPAVTIVAEHSHSTNDGLATLTSARYTETGTVTVYQTVNSTPTSTIITCAPTTIATSSVAPVTESSSSDSMINIVYIAILIGVVVLSALVFGVFFLRRRRRARPITPIQETIEVSSPRASSLFTDLKKRISVFVSPPSPGVGYENHHFLLPQELQGDAEHCVELPAVEMQEK